MANDAVNIDEINKSLSDWNMMIDSYICSIKEMLSSDDIHRIIKEYNERGADKIDLGFNVFTLISDLYYRENFHRDIIFDFLNPEGSHKQGDKYLMLFLDMLDIRHSDFQNAVVEKEFPINNRRRIDTLIKDEVSKKAIIIENKMNNAGDMYRQLPDYYNYIQSLGFDVICIVYLPLLHNKVPDHSGWSKTEIDAIRKCQKIIPAFSNKRIKNLCEDWLKPSIEISQNDDCSSVLRQYIKLIKYLNVNNMDYVILEKFYNNLKVGENLETASSIRNMMNELPSYLAARIQNKYMSNYSPFAKIWRYDNKDTVFEGFTLDGENQYYKLDVWCNENGYDMYFWNPENEQENIKSIFANSTALSDFQHIAGGLPNNVFLHLKFNQEDRVYEIIDLLLEELSAMNTKE
jgi:hypothetical protein